MLWRPRRGLKAPLIHLGRFHRSGMLSVNLPAEHAAGFAAWATLPRNPRPPAPPKVEQASAPSATVSSDSTIAVFNNSGSLKADLEADGFSCGVVMQCG